jgi:hypothetical protein
MNGLVSQVSRFCHYLDRPMFKKPSLFLKMQRFLEKYMPQHCRRLRYVVSPLTETVQKQSADADLQRQQEVSMMLI